MTKKCSVLSHEPDFSGSLPEVTSQDCIKNNVYVNQTDLLKGFHHHISIHFIVKGRKININPLI